MTDDKMKREKKKREVRKKEERGREREAEDWGRGREEEGFILRLFVRAATRTRRKRPE